MGCATQPKETVTEKIPEVTPEIEKLETQVLLYQSNEKAQTEEKTNFKSYKLVVVTLDKNKKPELSKSIVFDDLENSMPYGKNGPKITISKFSTENSDGKILQLSCANLDIKQKFDNALLLKGWASDIVCNKNNYFVMINK